MDAGRLSGRELGRNGLMSHVEARLDDDLSLPHAFRFSWTAAVLNYLERSDNQALSHGDRLTQIAALIFIAAGYLGFCTVARAS